MEKKILDKLHKSEVKILDEINRICKENNIEYFLVAGTLLGAVRHKGFIPWDDDLDIGMTRDNYEKFIKIAPKKLNSEFVLDDISTNENYLLIFAKVRLKNTIFEEKNMDEKYRGIKGIWVDIFPIDETNHYNDLYMKIKSRRIKLKKSLYLRKSNFARTKNSILLNFLLFLTKPVSIKSFNKNLVFDMKKENKEKCKYFINYGSNYKAVKQTHLKEKLLPLSKVYFEGKYYPAPKDVNYYLTILYGKDYMKMPPVEKRITHNPHRIVFEDGEEVIFNENG